MTEPRAMTGRVTLGNGEVRDLASPGKRLVARIIDIVIIVFIVVVLAIVGFVGVVLGSETDEDALAGMALFVGFGGLALFSILFLLYEPTLIAVRGQTTDTWQDGHEHHGGAGRGRGSPRLGEGPGTLGPSRIAGSHPRGRGVAVPAGVYLAAVG